MSIARENAAWAGCGGPTIRIEEPQLSRIRAEFLAREKERGYRWSGYYIQISDDGGLTWRKPTQEEFIHCITHGFHRGRCK